jgi:hypothetical protein
MQIAASYPGECQLLVQINKRLHDTGIRVANSNALIMELYGKLGEEKVKVREN